MLYLLAASLGLLLGFLPGVASAQISNPCPIPSIPCMGSIIELEAWGRTFAFAVLRVSFIGIAVVFFFFYAVRLLMEGDEESVITDVKNAYGQGVVGAAIVGISTLIVDAFGRPAAMTVVNPEPIELGLSNVVLYFRLMLSVAATALITMQAIRIVLLQGSESEMEKQRTRFFHGLLGVGIVILANSIVNALLPGARSGILALEVVGMINFLLTILGMLAVISLIVAGIFLIFSVEDGLKDRAKKTIFTAVVCLIVVLCAMVLTNYVLFL